MLESFPDAKQVPNDHRTPKVAAEVVFSLTSELQQYHIARNFWGIHFTQKGSQSTLRPPEVHIRYVHLISRARLYYVYGS